MANLSVLFKVFIFYLIAKEHTIESFIWPNIHIGFKYLNQFNNCSASSDTTKFNTGKATDILCPEGAKGSYGYPFSNSGYIVCWHQRTNFEKCPRGKVYNLIVGRCTPGVSQPIHRRENIYLHSCPYNDRQKHFYPYNARKYVRCSSGGQLTVLNCRSWEMFSIQQQNCLSETHIFRNDHVPGPAPPIHDKNHSNVPVAHRDIIFCPLDLFGVFPHPFSNERYLSCIHGRLYERSCGAGLVYDFMSKLCVKNSKNLFQILALPQNLFLRGSIVETQTSDNLTFLRCPKGLYGAFVHPFSCFDYIYCSPAGTEIKTCSNEKVYSFRDNKCEFYDRLDDYDHVPCIESNEGKEEGDSISLGVFCAPTGYSNYSHPQSQHKYVSCNNGKLQVKWCPRNEIFSLDELNCVPEATVMDEEYDDE